MQYQAPAVEARLELSAQLGKALPSETFQPVWRPAKPAKPRER